ncbi:MAG: YbgC/FadM family acyl-CoA thioesterase [Maricaulis sp.]|jgi:acyl-CoA thioester hydrolase|nr:YbgC/FadM family acyl-CoA thioesterase [Maricaulis sp.]
MSENPKPSAGKFDVDNIHRLAARVYYEDTDFSGLVYHARYLNFFERGRTDSLRCLGIFHHEIATHDEPTAFAVRRMNIEFDLAARIDDALVVETIYRPSKGARLMMDQRMLRGDETIARVSVQAICIDLTGRVKRAPKWMTKLWLPKVITPA